MNGLSLTLAQHVVNTPAETLSASTYAAMNRSLVDGLGVMLAASGMGEGCEAFAHLAEAEGPGPATLFGRGTTAPMLLAALANGALAHAIDFEDAHDAAPVHPNASAIPAALALAEARGGVSGRDLLAALAIGCDIACRMGLALDVNIDKFGFYPPPLLSAFGAVAACARIAGLSAGQTVDAWSLLLCSHTCSSELKYSPDSDVRAVREGFAAQAALQAVLLAQRGVSGFAAPIEGRAGFYALYARDAYTPERLLAGLGEAYAVEDLSYKQWPSCRGTHAFIEAALALRDGIVLNDLRKISLSGDGFLQMLMTPNLQKRRPATAIDAKFSLPFTVAHALVHGAVTLDSFARESLHDPKVLALVDLVDFAEDDTVGGMTSGKVTLTLAGGTSHECHVPVPLGSPLHPLTDDQIDAKFRDCASRARHALSPAGADKALASLRRIERVDDEKQGVALIG